MITSVAALLNRSLRTDARSLLNHLARLGLMAAIYIALCLALSVALRFGAPGLRFFKASIYLNAIFLTLLGIGFFSTTITEEKEEGTLGLMLMAGIGPLGLLLGKLGGRLIQAFLLVAVQYPFTLLAVTMGGVTSGQVQSSYLGLTSYMLMIAGAGVLCSTVARSSRGAGTYLVIILGLYAIVPFVCRELWSRLFVRSQSWLGQAMRLVMETSLFLQFEAITSSGWGESPWTTQVICNGLAGVVCFGLAWYLFGFTAEAPATEALSRGGLTRGKSGLRRSFSPGRAWKNPFIWKDFHFVAGGLSMRLVRIVSYLMLFPVTWLASELWHFHGWGDRFSQLIGVYLFFTLCALSWEISLSVARSIQDEIRGQTLASLVMLPRATTSVLYSKLLGTLLGIYPGILLFFVASFFGIRNIFEFMNPRDPGPFILAHLLLVPHLAAVFALWVRWGAVPLAIGTMVGLFAVWIVLGEVLFRMRDHQFNLIGVGVLILCGCCHLLVIFRIRQIAEHG